MELDAYGSAKKKKLLELKKTIMKMIAEEDGIEVPEEELGDSAEGEEEDDEGEFSSVPGEGEDLAVEDPEEELSELEQMKKDYFRPKAKQRRPGTAIMMALSAPMKPGLKDAIGKPKNVVAKGRV